MKKSLVVHRSLLAIAAVIVATSCSSNDTTGTASSVVPQVPTGVSATPLYGQVTVSWDYNAGAESNDIFWSTTAGGAAAGTKIENAPSDTILTGLTNGTTYYYVVVANNSNGSSAPSAEVSAKPLATMVAAAPTKVKAAPGPQEDTVKWAAVNGAASYNVYWATESGIDPTKPATYSYKIASASSAYLHALLDNGSTYYYVVTAVNANGESAASDEVSSTPASVPAAATLVSAKNGTKSDTVLWRRDTVFIKGGGSYNVYRSTTAGVTYASLKFAAVGTKYPADTTKLYYADTATNATPYFYTVAAQKKGVQSPLFTPEVTATPSAPPAIPTTVAGAIASATSATITWTAVAGVTNNIYWKNAAAVTIAKGTKVPGAVSPATVTGLTAGTRYFFVVTGVENGVESAVSTEVSVVPNVLPPAPLTASLSATPAGASDTIRWAAGATASTSNIYWSLTAGITVGGTGVTKIADVSTGYVQTGLANGTQVYYKVSAENSAGEGPLSTEFSTTPAAPPAKLVGVTAVLGDQQNTISWTASATAGVVYNIYTSTDPGVTLDLVGAGVTQIPGVTSPYVDAGLTNGTTYYYVVTATKSGVESPISAEVAGTPLGATVLNAAVVATGKATLSWTPQAGALSYNLYRAATAGVAPGATGSTKVGGGGNANPYVDAVAAGTYYYVVTAVNASGESIASNEVTAVVP